MPISFTMLTENIPIHLRGRILTLVGINYTFGEMLVCLLGYFFLDNLKSGNCTIIIYVYG